MLGLFHNLGYLDLLLEACTQAKEEAGLKVLNQDLFLLSLLLPSVSTFPLDKHTK